MARSWILAFACFIFVCAVPASAGNVPTLFGKVGPDFDITLKTSGGSNIKQVTAGTYRIVVSDQSGDDNHNFRLKGFGVSRATSVPFVGTRRWTVRFTRGKLYRFVCDPHAFVMRGSFKAV